MNNITLDECFQFGLGAFETIGIEQGTPIFLEKHLKKLWQQDYMLIFVITKKPSFIKVVKDLQSFI